MSRLVAERVAARVHASTTSPTPGDFFEYHVGAALGARSCAATTASCARSRTCAATAAARCARAGRRAHRDPLPVPPLDLGPRGPPPRGAVAQGVRRRATTTSRCSPVQVDTWGPLVFVNLDPDAGAARASSSRPCPTRLAWADLDEFRCQAAGHGAGRLQLEDAHRRLQRDVPRAGHPPRDARRWSTT